MTSLLRLLPWSAAAFGIALSVQVFYPGYLSWDSAYQWWQVRHHAIDTTHPPIMVWIWTLTNTVKPGPSGYFLFQTALYWIALSLFVTALRVHAVWKALLVLVLGLWPPLWGLSVHLWKDVGTMGFFCLAAACCAQDLARPHRGWRIAAFFAVVLACMYRYNALPGAFPFMAYGLYRERSLRPAGKPRGKIAVVLVGTLLCGLIQALVLLPNYLLHLRSEPLWPMQAQWDIAAVSVQENRVLFPREWISPQLTIDILRRDFNPVFNVPLYKSGLIKLNPYMDMREQDFDVLRRTWLRLPIDHSQAYWNHRFNVMKTLFGWQHDPDNGSLVFAPGIVPYRDNPQVAPGPSDIRQRLEADVTSIVRGPLFWGWLYASWSVLVLVLAWRRGDAMMATLAGSGLLYAAPLLVLAPSCEFRYLSWLVQSGFLATLTVFAGPAGRTPDHVTSGRNGRFGGSRAPS